MAGAEPAESYLEAPVVDFSSDNELESSTSGDVAGVGRATVYDAVSGKATRPTISGSTVAERGGATWRLRPDEVLWRRLDAPARYEETDFYFAHRELGLDKKLPPGDLLNALHGHVSHLYQKAQGEEEAAGERRTEDRGGEHKRPGTWRFMDETALIALGILLEEMAKETLGPTGDLALVEAAWSEGEEDGFVEESDGSNESRESSQSRGRSPESRSLNKTHDGYAEEKAQLRGLIKLE